MTVPAENFTVRKSITTRTACMVGFPLAPLASFSAPICPYQFLIAPIIGVIMCFPSTFTTSPCSSPRLFNNIKGKCHTTPPLVVKANYSTKPKDVNITHKGSFALMLNRCYPLGRLCLEGGYENTWQSLSSSAFGWAFHLLQSVLCSCAQSLDLGHNKCQRSTPHHAF